MAAISLIEMTLVRVLAATPVEDAARICMDAPFRRAGPAAAKRSGQGFSLIEVVFVAGLVATLAAMALPSIQRVLDEFRTVGATRYVAGRLERARIEALSRSTSVAMRFVQEGTTYRYGVYMDGNRNGVRSADITGGIDRLVSHEERLPDQFSGVDIGVLPGLPAADSSSAAPGSDPVRLGSGNIATFTTDGTATPGSLYILGPHALQMMIRIVGETGRTRILRFDARNRVWKPL